MNVSKPLVSHLMNRCGQAVRKRRTAMGGAVLSCLQKQDLVLSHGGGEGRGEGGGGGHTYPDSVLFTSPQQRALGNTLPEG